VGIGIPRTIPSWIDSDNYAMEYMEAIGKGELDERLHAMQQAKSAALTRSAS
jgi:hypothetical protein